MWGEVLGAGISAAGQLYSNQQNIENQNKLFSEQINLANSAHQREVNDLRLAGLNPILSAQGSGADVPNPSAATQENPLASAAQIVSMEAQAKQADAAQTAAENGSWLVYDAKTLGEGGFQVKFLGKHLSMGADAKIHTIQTIRINKVTGETYDALTGKRVQVVEPKPVSSGKSVPAGEVTVFEGDGGKGAKVLERIKYSPNHWTRTQLR